MKKKYLNYFFAVFLLSSPLKANDVEPYNAMSYSYFATNPRACSSTNFQQALWYLRQILVNPEKNSWLLHGTKLSYLNPTGGVKHCFEILREISDQDGEPMSYKKGDNRLIGLSILSRLNEDLAPNEPELKFGKIIAGLLAFVLAGSPKYELKRRLHGIPGQEVTIQQAIVFLKAIMNPETKEIYKDPNYLKHTYQAFVQNPDRFARDFFNESSRKIKKCSTHDLKDLEICMVKAIPECRKVRDTLMPFFVYDIDHTHNKALLKTLDPTEKSQKKFTLDFNHHSLSNVMPKIGDVYCLKIRS
ncbi:MAG: hypothetical protein CMM87_05975 [Rickettsiales bacterium]|nr:hypothetical protein [Rickettsiales bacterium]